MRHIDREFKNYFDYLKKTFLYPEIRSLCLFRKAQRHCKSKNPFRRLAWSLRWLRVRKRGYQVSLDADIGPGLRFLHDGVRIIVGASKIGANCTVGVNVIIGYGRKTETSAPTIGNRVYIGHNSSIVGGITIGDDVLIAPNTFVNRDIPSNSIVVGNNQIISKEAPSAPYLKMGP